MKKNISKFFDKIRQLYWKWWPYSLRPSQIRYLLKGWWNQPNRPQPRYLGVRSVDKVELLPHMLFEILSVFVERECSPGHVDWKGTNHRIEVNGVSTNVRDEMQALYDWWHTAWNKEYIEYEEKLWEEIRKTGPTWNFLGKSGKKYGEDEDWTENEEWAELLLEHENEEKEQEYHDLIQKQMAWEKSKSEELIRMMERVCRLQPYLWT